MHVDAAKCQQQVWLLLLANQKHTFAQQEIKSYYWLIFIIKKASYATAFMILTAMFAILISAEACYICFVYRNTETSLNRHKSATRLKE